MLETLEFGPSQDGETGHALGVRTASRSEHWSWGRGQTEVAVLPQEAVANSKSQGKD